MIGAGPAGSLAAYLVARAGLTVTLAEQQRFPRDKVCGECLSAMARATLERSGLSGPLRALAPAELIRTSLVGPDGTVATHDLPRPMWGLTRRTMDVALLGLARAAGAEVLQPARVESLDPDAAGITAALRLEDNAVVRRAFDLVLLADGKSALLGDKPRPTGDLGVKAHFRGVRADPGSIHLFTLDGHYGGLAAVEDGLWNVALSVPDVVVRKYDGDLERLWADAVRGHPFLARAFAGSERVGKILASPLPRFPVRGKWPANLIPVGNAAAALEPIGGEGMGLAMRSAELAADAILTARDAGTGVDITSLRRDYGRLWRTRRAACRSAAMALSHPGVAGIMIPWSAGCEDLTRAVLRLMGKASVR